MCFGFVLCVWRRLYLLGFRVFVGGGGVVEGLNEVKVRCGEY